MEKPSEKRLNVCFYPLVQKFFHDIVEKIKKFGKTVGKGIGCMFLAPFPKVFSIK